MPPGHYQTFAEESHSLPSSRYGFYLVFSLKKKYSSIFVDEFASFAMKLPCQVRPALPALQRLVYSNDEEVLTDACWALSYLSDGTNDKIQAVIEAGVCQRLVELLL